MSDATLTPQDLLAGRLPPRGVRVYAGRYVTPLRNVILEEAWLYKALEAPAALRAEVVALYGYATIAAHPYLVVRRNEKRDPAGRCLERWTEYDYAPTVAVALERAPGIQRATPEGRRPCGAYVGAARAVLEALRAG